MQKMSCTEKDVEWAKMPPLTSAYWWRAGRYSIRYRYATSLICTCSRTADANSDILSRQRWCFYQTVVFILHSLKSLVICSHPPKKKFWFKTLKRPRTIYQTSTFSNKNWGLKKPDRGFWGHSLRCSLHCVKWVIKVSASDSFLA